MSRARVSFLTLLSEESSPMPPLWAATLFSNISPKMKNKITGGSVKGGCDFVLIKTFGEPARELIKINELRIRAKKVNKNCLIIVGGWGPTLYPESYVKVSDAIIPGVYGEAFSPFNQLLTYWAEGKVDKLHEIDGLGVDGQKSINRIPTQSNPVNWEDFCARLNIKLSDCVRFKINEHAQVLFLPFQTSPLSCANYLTPLLENLSKKEKLQVGCADCGAAVSALRFVKKLKEINSVDLLHSMYINPENYRTHLKRIEAEIKSLHRQLLKEDYHGRKIYYLANDSVRLIGLKLILDVLERKFEKEPLFNLAEGIEVYVRPELLKTAIEEAKRRGLLSKFTFKVKVWYGSQEDLNSSHRNNDQKDIQQYFECVRRYKECRYVPYFSLTSKRSTCRDFIENLIAVISSIGEGIYWYTIGWEKTSSKIAKKASEYLCHLNRWIENPKLSNVILRDACHPKSLKEVYSALGEFSYTKKAQLTLLSNVLERISQEKK